MEYTNKTPVPEEVAKEHKKKMTKAQLLAAIACAMSLGINLDDTSYTDPKVWEDAED